MAITMTPFQKVKGAKTNLSHLHVFGRNIIMEFSGRRPEKLNKNIATGIFLWCIGHNRDILFYDNRTCQTWSVQHLEFDESHYYDSQRLPYA